MVAACLATSTPPPGLTGFVRAHGDGTPFLVEELLAGLVAAGTLHREDGLWVTGDELTPTVPASLRESIRRRVGLLDATARRVVGAAAMLGRRFDWELLPGIADVDGLAVVDALRAAVDAQIVAVDGRSGSGGFVFRHALTREAVLGDLLPPERRRLAQQAWPAVERANPGLPGATCELAAELAEAAGALDAAAERLVESARRALATGALATAEGTARHARRLAPPDEPVARDADETLVRVLVAAGKPVEARELGLAAGWPRLAPPTGRTCSSSLADAALTAGDVAAAERRTSRPRAPSPDGAGPRVDAVAAAMALDQVRLDDAVRLGHSALAAATDQPEVQCAALESDRTRGTGPRGVRGARRWFERAAELAERHGIDRVASARPPRARHPRLGRRRSERAMRATRDLAARTARCSPWP